VHSTEHASVVPAGPDAAGNVWSPTRVSDADRVGAVRLLRFPAVRDRTGLSRSTIWRLERQGTFPKHHRISANAVAWVEEEIANWIRSKVTDIAV
jgi:prophage regulatory protein